MNGGSGTDNPWKTLGNARDASLFLVARKSDGLPLEAHGNFNGTPYHNVATIKSDADLSHAGFLIFIQD
jgi:hypothetical protein